MFYTAGPLTGFIMLVDGRRAERYPDDHHAGPFVIRGGFIEPVIHILLHFVVPAFVVGLLFRPDWKKAYLIMVATMVVDLDHLLADPVYDPQRCSIGFHPLHTLWAIAFYFVLCFPKKTRYIGIGLMIHMVLDLLDCQLTNGI